MHIPNPCYQDWSKMTPTAHGRTCASCSSLVADMTRLSNDEILALIGKENVHCGRFYEDQLQTPQIKGGVLSEWFGKFNKEWAFLSMLALLELSVPSELSAKNIQPRWLSGENREEGRKNFDGDTGRIMPGFIQGEVNRASGTVVYPQQNRKVFIHNSKGKRVGIAVTDDKGMFAFALPDGISQNEYTLVLKSYKHKSLYRVYHYHRMKFTWSPDQPWIELKEEVTSKRKPFAPRRVVTGKFR